MKIPLKNYVVITKNHVQLKPKTINLRFVEWAKL